jgi:tetratricopeptide (TPR) repeat protein
MNRQNPGDHEILLNMAYCYEYLKQLDTAEKYYRAAAKVNSMSLGISSVSLILPVTQARSHHGETWEL